MKVKMTADLGSWVQPTKPRHSQSGDQDYQSPRRRTGPSYLRRQKKRAAARAAAAVRSAEQVDQDQVEDVVTAPPAAAATCAAATQGSKPAARTCSKCGQPCSGHVGPAHRALDEAQFRFWSNLS